MFDKCVDYAQVECYNYGTTNLNIFHTNALTIGNRCISCYALVCVFKFVVKLTRMHLLYLSKDEFTLCSAFCLTIEIKL